MSNESAIKFRLEFFAKHSPIDKFILENGQAFNIHPDTYKGRRMKQGMCFRNATLRALKYPNLRYVEGLATVHGVPLQHAWNVRDDGVLIDPTWQNIGKNEYFGVVFSNAYLEKAMTINGYYGALDGMYNRKTIQDLIEGKAQWRG